MGHPVVSHQILPRTFSRPLAGFAAPPAARAPRTWRAGVPPAENEGKKDTYYRYYSNYSLFWIIFR